MIQPTPKLPEEFLAQASNHAQRTKKLLESITVASGAVVGGPVPTPPPVTSVPPATG